MPIEQNIYSWNIPLRNQSRRFVCFVGKRGGAGDELRFVKLRVTLESDLQLTLRCG
jgi:hypothetical protein